MPAPFCCVACAHGRSSHRRRGTHADRAGAQRIARGRAARRSRRALPSARPSTRCPSSIASEIVDVMVGCGYPEQRQGMNLARRAALLADLPPAAAGTTVNRFCASSLQTIRMAFHAIRAGEGDAYVAAGVESISQVNGYPEGRRRAASPADRLGRRDRQRLHPDGDDGGERRGALRRRAGGDGPLRAALARAGRRGAAVRTLRPRDHAVHEGGRHGRLPGRRASAAVDAGGAGAARACLQGGRESDGRQLVPAERRRCGRRRDERLASQASSASRRRHGSSPRRSRASIPRSWAWGRSRRCAAC